ncbi:DUF742 domain-containing protein [Amycolatopsis suaedae]|uniref:DUF742 domain-containing protein n=1 Tax=Amycolatopsis suaedae TaxID=2510978 RepID=A0A4Q7J2W0_9PSEU|nr:DUF742 domain-containing protein [Amycolatopsis suaedae]RZQ61800.1 DUF742 domain-containing protein [Amycolatopsis suaedae]
MDSGRSRGDFSGAGWPGESDNANAGGTSSEDWKTFRDRIDREWRARRSDGEPEPGGRAGGDQEAGWLRQADGESLGGPSVFNVDDFRDRLLSGPGSELYGGGSSIGGEPAGFAAFNTGGTGEFAGVPSARSGSLPPEEPQESSGLVRPYFRTGGRTKPTYDLAIEALISTSERGRVIDSVRVPEHRSICDLCLDTRSVAEVAALLRLPLGVVRVLIGDVAGLGLVLIHSSSSVVGDRPSIEFMERVLSGLRRI